MSEIESEWSQWSVERWNAALLEAVFYGEETDASPITRIDATDDFLAKVAGAPAEQGDAVRAAFIALFRQKPSAVRNLLDADVVRKTWNPESDQPNFFATLYLTLIVASATEETYDEGNFRVRFATLLGLDNTLDYIRPSFSLLWVDLAEWSEQKADAGELVRRLILPDPQNERIIGYSKRLAFPSFKDLDRLSKLMARGDVSAESPIDTILNAIGSEKGFSEQFKREFRAFRTAVENNAEDLGQDTPFWGALEAVSWKPELRAAEGGGVRARMSLDVGMEGSAAALEIFVDRMDVELTAASWRVCELPTPLDDFVGFITSAQNGPGESAGGALLSGNGGPTSLITGTYLHRAIAQGCVCFAPGEAIRWVDSRVLPGSGQVRLLIRDDVFDDACRVLVRQGLKVPLEQILDGVEGWRLLEAVDCDEELRGLSDLPPFSSFDVFKRAMPRPRLELRGAVRMRDGVLFLRPILPEVGTHHVDNVAFVSSGSDGETDISGTLVERPGMEESTFEFTQEHMDAIPVPGTLRLRALQEGKSVRSRSFDLVGTCSSRDRRRPEPLADWLVDGTGGQLAPPGDLWEADEDTIPNELMMTAQLRHVVNKISSSPIAQTPSSTISTTAWKPPETLPSAWREIIESLAGVLSCRKGMPVRDLLRWIARGFDVEERTTWSILDCLSHCRLLVRLYSRRWRGQTLFAQDPVLIHFDHFPEPEARVIGLLSHHLRIDLCRAARDMSLDPLIAVLGDWSGMGCLRIKGCSLDEAHELGSQTGVSVRSASDVPLGRRPSSPRKILSIGSPRVRVDQPGRESAFWVSRRWMEVPRPADAQLALERRRYENQQEIFILWVDDAPAWTTQSNRWASLISGRAIDKEPWFLGSDGALILKHAIPEAFGYRALMFGDGVSGVDWRSGSSERCLAFGSPKVARESLGEWAPSPAGEYPRTESLTRWANAFGVRDEDSLARTNAFRRRIQVINKATN